MMNKKGQGALEFLTTYGWAFLVILIMIGALGYFGILNPTRFLPERCNVNSEFSCEEFAVVAGSNELNFTIVLKNSLGQGIVLNDSVSTLSFTSDYFGIGVAPNGTGSNTSIEGSTVFTADNNEINCGTDTSNYAVDPEDTFVVKCVAKGSALVLADPNPGTKVKIGFSMTYKPRGKTLQKPISGEIFAAVQ